MSVSVQHDYSRRMRSVGSKFAISLYKRLGEFVFETIRATGPATGGQVTSDGRL